jgi:hypothetical protein
LALSLSAAYAVPDRLTSNPPSFTALRVKPSGARSVMTPPFGDGIPPIPPWIASWLSLRSIA